MDCASEWIQQFQHNDDPFCDDPKFQCIGYEIYENSRDSSRILIFETWRDAASLEAHQQTEHFRLRAPRNRELSETSVLSRFEF